MSDIWDKSMPGLSAPVRSMVAVITGADVTLAQTSRAIYVGGAGALHCDLADGTTITIANLSVGWHPIRVTKVYTAGTSCTDTWAAW